jgi:hypothetical protein
MSGHEVTGRITDSAGSVMYSFQVTVDTRVGVLMKRFFGDTDPFVFTYNGTLMGPECTLEFYHFQDGGVIVATKESDILKFCKEMKSAETRPAHVLDLNFLLKRRPGMRSRAVSDSYVLAKKEISTRVRGQSVDAWLNESSGRATDDAVLI